MDKIRNIITCLILTLLASGCASGRIADLRDCGRLSAGYGIGLGAEASLGIIGNPSVGIMSHKAMFGHEGRYRSGIWEEQEIFWPSSSVMAFLFRGWDDGRGDDGFYFAPYGRMMGDKLHPPENKTVYQRNMLVAVGNRDAPSSSTFHTLTDFECGATLGVISARVGVNPLEILDFFLGMVGIDIAKDDPKAKVKKSDKAIQAIPD